MTYEHEAIDPECSKKRTTLEKSLQEERYPTPNGEKQTLS